MRMQFQSRPRLQDAPIGRPSKSGRRSVTVPIMQASRAGMWRGVALMWTRDGLMAPNIEYLIDEEVVVMRKDDDYPAVLVQYSTYYYIVCMDTLCTVVCNQPNIPPIPSLGISVAWRRKRESW